jgi:uncharacterized membrane protein YeaQ/YmgE (transglycosylase-associated protein family)
MAYWWESSTILMLLVGAIVGVFASIIFKGASLGLASNICVGLTGAVIGGFVLPEFLPLSRFAIPFGGFAMLAVCAGIGAAFLLFAVNLINRISV